MGNYKYSDTLEKCAHCGTKLDFFGLRWYQDRLVFCTMNCAAGYNTLAVGKESNPKREAASDKIMPSAVPGTAVPLMSLALTEGGLKYGFHNYRTAGARASTYYDALFRHMAKWYNGQEKDPKTGVPHLASAMACIAIMADCQVTGNLTDDRPPCPGGDPDKVAAWIDSLEETVKGLKEKFGVK